MATMTAMIATVLDDLAEADAGHDRGHQQHHLEREVDQLRQEAAARAGQLVVEGHQLRGCHDQVLSAELVNRIVGRHGRRQFTLYGPGR